MTKGQKGESKQQQKYSEKMWKRHAQEQEKKTVKAEKWANDLKGELIRVSEILHFFMQALVEDGAEEPRKFSSEAGWGLYHMCILLDERLDRVLWGDAFKEESQKAEEAA